MKENNSGYLSLGMRSPKAVHAEANKLESKYATTTTVTGVCNNTTCSANSEEYKDTNNCKWNEKTCDGYSSDKLEHKTEDLSNRE